MDHTSIWFSTFQIPSNSHDHFLHVLTHFVYMLVQTRFGWNDVFLRHVAPTESASPRRMRAQPRARASRQLLREHQARQWWTSFRMIRQAVSVNWGRGKPWLRGSSQLHGTRVHEMLSDTRAGGSCRSRRPSRLVQALGGFSSKTAEDVQSIVWGSGPSARHVPRTCSSNRGAAARPCASDKRRHH